MPGSAIRSMTWKDLGAGLSKSALQNLHFTFAPNKRAKAAAHRRLEPRRSLANEMEPIDPLRLGLALDGVFACESSVDHALHQYSRAEVMTPLPTEYEGTLNEGGFQEQNRSRIGCVVA